MGKHNRSGHEFFGLVTSIPEHYTLIARPLFVGFLALRRSGVNPLSNIPRLSGQLIGDENVIGMKHVVIVDVSNLLDCLPDNLLVIELRVRGNLAGNRYAIALDECFARDTALGILLKAGVQHVVRNRIGYFVGVPSPTDSEEKMNDFDIPTFHQMKERISSLFINAS